MLLIPSKPVKLMYSWVSTLMQRVSSCLYYAWYKLRIKLLVIHWISHIYQPLSGSPLQYTVGHFTEVGAHRVRAVGVALQRAETNRPKSCNLYTREAGEGVLDINVEGPSKAEIAVEEHKVCVFDTSNVKLFVTGNMWIV